MSVEPPSPFHRLTERRDVRVVGCVPRTLKDRLEHSARSNGRSISGELAYAIRWYLIAQERPVGWQQLAADRDRDS